MNNDDTMISHRGQRPAISEPYPVSENKQAAPNGVAEGITADAVSMRYPSDRGSDLLALDGVTLTVRNGEFVALLGPSGCGKSTLLKIIAGLLAPTTGTVRINDHPVRGPYTDLGMVFQQDLLFEWRTAVQNVLAQFTLRGLPSKPHHTEAMRLLAAVGLEHMEDRHPYELSGGMRQRVAICRALVHDPPLLLLDEPFGALDALTRDQLRLDLEQLWAERRKTALLVTHDIEEAVFLAQRVIVMTPRPGRIQSILEIDLPFPRTLRMRSEHAFTAYIDEIRHQFEQMGVLRDLSGTSDGAPQS